MIAEPVDLPPTSYCSIGAAGLWSDVYCGWRTCGLGGWNFRL